MESNELTGQSGDSLKVNYDEETNQLQLEWDENDPQWGFLSLMEENEIHDFIFNALESGFEKVKAEELKDDIESDEI